MTAVVPLSAIGAEQAAGVFPDDLAGPLQPRAVAATTTPFGTLFGQGIAHVDEALRASESGMQRLALGDVQNVHQVMIQLEEARISFQFMMQVRGRLLEAYQDVMKMQV
jgi:flagellar hook-basal body complex protein FliE